MLTQDFSLQLKAVDKEGTFTGFASTYNNVDLVGDAVMPGSFTKSIQLQGDGYPVLWCHDQSQPLGIGKIRDDPKGLIIDGKLTMADPNAQRVLAHMKSGSVRGLSIGYDLPRSPDKTSYAEDGTRILREIKLFEVSLVSIPANPKAMVTAVKSLSDVERVLHGLRDASEPAVVAQLRQIDAELKRLLPGRKNALCECTCEECQSGDCEGCTNPDCEDINCEGNFADAEEVAALKEFAASLKSLAA
jgi:HK97 family phage prohead protease